MDGIDRYEAQSIARDEARAVADEIRRDLEYGEIAQLRRDLASLEDRLRSELGGLRERVGIVESNVG